MPIVILKPKGSTPLDIVKKYKKENKIKDKVCYAGRLDPMAHGKMILLKGLECKEMNKYCKLNKTYEFIVLFGFKSDTYDLLGKVELIRHKLEANIETSKYEGKFEQQYPAYSSFIVRHNELRKPLWEWTKMGKLSEIKISKKEVEIFSFDEIENNLAIINYKDLKKYIFENINLLSEENKLKFRAYEILDIWQKIFEKKELSGNPIIKKFRARVSSGTYIRSLTNQIGLDYKCGGITLDIKRVNIEL